MPYRVHFAPCRLISHFVKSEAASVAVEFAILAVPFIVLIVGALEIFVIQQAQAVLETTAEYAGRQILTGSVQTKGMSQTDFHNLVCAALPPLLKCPKIMIDVQDASSFASANITLPTITYDKDGNVTNQWQYQPGAPAKIVVLRLMYEWPTFNLLGLTLHNQPNGTLLLMATSVFKNESYE